MQAVAAARRLYYCNAVKSKYVNKWTALLPTPAADEGVVLTGVSVSVCFSAGYLKTDAARIKKFDTTSQLVCSV